METLDNEVKVEYVDNPETQKSKPKWSIPLLIGLALLIVIGFAFLPPIKKPAENIFTITKGESLYQITNELESAGIIRSSTVFRSLVILLGGEKKIIAGSYLFENRQSPLLIASRFMNGDFGLEDKKVTIPEGWNIYQIADLLEKELVNFNKKAFIELAKDKEGYLFPDTYFLPVVVEPKQILDIMSSNFSKKIAQIDGLSESTHSLKEILTVASILEGEAITTESRKIVAGILWRRISIGMPLQVDATFKYINGKNTYELSLEDLKIDSLYNTYKYKGLPPGPINNPGMDAILAALNPTKTNYLYFLSSRDGKMYYATTFEGHQVNREKYLNK